MAKPEYCCGAVRAQLIAGDSMVVRVDVVAGVSVASEREVGDMSSGGIIRAGRSGVEGGRDAVERVVDALGEAGVAHIVDVWCDRLKRGGVGGGDGAFGLDLDLSFCRHLRQSLCLSCCSCCCCCWMGEVGVVGESGGSSVRFHSGGI